MSEQSTETWKPVPLLGGKYEASSLGRIRNTETGRVLTGGIVSPGGGRKYRYYCLSDPTRSNKYGYSGSFIASKLVASAFKIPRKPTGKPQQLRYKDGDTLNNAPSNLEYVTMQNRAKMSWRTRGAQDPCYKHSPEDVLEIRQRYYAGDRIEDIAADMVCSTNGVYLVATGRVARHLKPESYKGKKRKLRPELRRGGKLSLELARKIRRDYARLKNLSKVAAIYGVDPSSVWLIKNNKRWVEPSA